MVVGAVAAAAGMNTHTSPFDMLNLAFAALLDYRFCFGFAIRLPRQQEKDAN